MQYRWNTGQVEYRIGEMQDRWNAGLDRCRKGGIHESSVVEPEPPFLAGAGAVKKGVASAPALHLKLQLWPYV